MNKQTWSKSLLSLVILVGMLFLPLMMVGAEETATAAAAPETQTVLSLSVGEFISIVISLSVFVFGLGKIIWDWARKGGNLDERLMTHATTTQANREEMDRLEKAYAMGGLQSKTAVDGLVAALQIIAPLTATKADNTYLELLLDIQKKGAPETPVPIAPPVVAQSQADITAYGGGRHNLYQTELLPTDPTSAG